MYHYLVLAWCSSVLLSHADLGREVDQVGRGVGYHSSAENRTPIMSTAGEASFLLMALSV